MVWPWRYSLGMTYLLSNTMWQYYMVWYNSYNNGSLWGWIFHSKRFNSYIIYQNVKFKKNSLKFSVKLSHNFVWTLMYAWFSKIGSQLFAIETALFPLLCGWIIFYNNYISVFNMMQFLLNKSKLLISEIQLIIKYGHFV